MGAIDLKPDDRNLRLFNSPIELGLRCMFVLSAFNSLPISIDKLIYLDYFLIHSGDVSKERKSIHPKYPFRSTEIVVKRELLMRALQLLLNKELITVAFSTEGIEYKITDIGTKALEYFESNYSKQIRETSEWLFEKYKDSSDEQMALTITNNLQKWGGEFSNEVKFRSI